MAERNLLPEGFIFNTLTQAGTISGTQVVSPNEMILLADGNFSSTALLVSGSRQTVLDADLGARWKINRVELYTSDASASNFEMEISDNNLDFNPLTMTGSAGLWVGSLPDSTISGSPRYIRYRHHPAINTTIQEWRVINDDTLVDFGPGGNETLLQIDDAPIGRPSDVIETLTIKNNHTKVAEGFALIDRTFNSAEDEVEISVSPSGPWFGRNTSLSNQPENVPWEQGNLSNTRVVPSGSAFFSFTNGSANGWSMVGATQSIVDGVLRGQTITQNPLVFISSEFVPFVDEETYDSGTQRHLNKFVFRAKDVDNVRVRARVQTPLQLSNILEGPRLFWKTEQNVEASASTFRSELSVLSTAGTAITGGFQDFIFPVETVPTWSGSIRGLAFRPFTVATGTNIIFDVSEIDAYSTCQNSIVLDFNAVPSGSFSLPLNFDTALNDSQNETIISFRHRITQDCIITKVGTYLNPSADVGIFLARRLSGGNFPLPGNNFTAINGVTLVESSAITSQRTLSEVPVYWQAQRGDVICAHGANLFNEGFLYNPGSVGDAFVSVSGVSVINSLANFSSAINVNTFSSVDRNYLIYYEAIPTEIGGYKASGTYRTPVFDLGQTLPLADLDFDALTPVGTSLDTSGQVGFGTVRARASSTPAKVGLALGEVGVISGTNQTLGLFLNENEIFNTSPKNDQQINLRNSVVSVDESTFIQNLGGAITYHENKDEIWILDCIISGTAPFVNTDARPTWDVYSPHTGQYLRTDHVKGSITYGYDGTNGLENAGDVRGFLPVGFAIDYDLSEIYLFQRVPGFTIGAGEYYGMVLDLDGNFKDLFWRSGTLGLNVSAVIPNERILAHTIGFTYAPDLKDPTVLTEGPKGVFFILHDTETSTIIGQRNVGRRITAFRNGNDIGIRNVGVINTTSVSSITGLGFAGDENSPTGLVYNRRDGLLYLHFDNVSGTHSGANKNPQFIAIRPSFNSLSQVEYSITSISGSAIATAPDVNGLSKQFRGEDSSGSTVSQWSGIQNRSPNFTMGVAHCNARDSFYILRSYFGERSSAFPKDFVLSTEDSPMTKRSLNLLFECGAGNVTTLATASTPSKADPLWGTVSGTLQFQDISVEGVNFPTGRYVQVEYQLNSNSQQTLTPRITNSKIAQGLRIGQIPAGGSKDIYVRTNIPEGQTIGDQEGRVIVFLESEE